MGKYIYYNNDLRCKIKKSDTIGEFEIQPQKRIFIFWFDCYKWMVYAERKPTFGHPYINPMRLSYQYGNEFECWDTGTMTITKRCNLLIEEYIVLCKRKKEWDKEYENLHSL